MESDIVSTGQMYSLLGWVDKNRKQIISTAVIVVVVGIVVAFVIWRGEQKQIEAGETLSGLFIKGAAAGVDAGNLLKVADDYSGTAASARALLVAAGQLFESGKVAEAQAGFEKFAAQYSGNPLMSQAKLGLAVCLNSQGKTNEAAVAFKEVVDRFGGEQAATPAKFYLAGIYEAQGKPEMARDLFMDLARNSQSTFGSQAMARLNDMFQKNPLLRPGAVSASPVTIPPASATP